MSSTSRWVTPPELLSLSPVYPAMGLGKVSGESSDDTPDISDSETIDLESTPMSKKRKRLADLKEMEKAELREASIGSRQMRHRLLRFDAQCRGVKRANKYRVSSRGGHRPSRVSTIEDELAFCIRSCIMFPRGESGLEVWWDSERVIMKFQQALFQANLHNYYAAKSIYKAPYAYVWFDRFCKFILVGF